MNIKNIPVTNHNLSDIVNINAYSGSFDFLKNEPNLYSVSDIKKMILGTIGKLSNEEISLIKTKLTSLFL